ncbi:MAG: MFS transporter, partial [Pseudorhodobacter sp.]
KLAGLLMGTAAALEIPFMLLAGYYTRRFGKRPMMLLAVLAVLAGVGFYGGLVTLSSQHALIALQLLNAIFIGIVAGIGMSYFQDLMPGRAGVAPARCCSRSRTGSSVAGAIAGTVAELWSFHGVFMVAAALALMALAACWRVPNV